ncbi:MAG: glycoside hydrolase family 57 protein [Cytophagales bacterium]
MKSNIIQLYFQVHQPVRISEYTFFDIGSNTDYFNESLNIEILQKVSKNCYLPANEMLTKLIKKFPDTFKITFSFSGIFLEMIEKYVPEVLVSFQDLVKTGNVEVISETYYHSLASLYDIEEFKEQIILHQEIIQRLFQTQSSVFRNTELLMHEELFDVIKELHYTHVLCEGTSNIFDSFHPHTKYTHKATGIELLPRNFELSDEIAYRFSDTTLPQYPLTSEKFKNILETYTSTTHKIYMDYETFGEHHSEETGILTFFNDCVNDLITKHNYSFEKISYDTNAPKTEQITLKPQLITSWADFSKDATAWLGNNLQRDAIKQIYDFKTEIFASKNTDLLAIWRKLQTSDHFYYMSTKRSTDGEVHSYFSPFKTAHDAYLFYTNIIKDLLNKKRLA